jgi:hypothetical protein
VPTRHRATGGACGTRFCPEARRLAGNGFPADAAWSRFGTPV